MKVIIISRHFLQGHPKEGQPTFFVDKIFKTLRSTGFIPLDNVALMERYKEVFGEPSYRHGDKYHTVRAGENWKKGDRASLRVWSGLPYKSYQVEFARVVLSNVWSFTFHGGCFSVNGEKYYGDTEGDFELLETIANNDGLTRHEFVDWFKLPKNKTFTGQILCWSDKIQY